MEIKKAYRDLFENFVLDVMRVYEAKGIAVAAVDRDGTTLYQRFFGYADEREKREINEDTIFGLASVTKSFTTLSIMQLEEQGRLSVDDPVSKYIPEYKNLNQETVLIRHLMTHSAGFYPLPRILVGDVASEMGLVEDKNHDFAYHDGLAQRGIELVASRLDAQPERIGRPGEYMSYSNDSFALLTDIIRRVGDCDSYSEYVMKHIVKPLGMERSCPDFIRPREDDNSCTLYRKDDGSWVENKDFYDNAFVLMGGGGMKSTLADMKRYVRMYLNDGALEGTRVATEYSARQMCMPKMLYRHQVTYGYGLSCEYQDDLTIWGHGGALPGVSSNIAWSQELGVGIIVLCNTSDVGVALISNSLMKVLNGKNPVMTRDLYEEHPWSLKEIKQASGTYVSGEGTAIELYQKENETIGMRVNGKESNIIPVSRDMAIIRNTLSDGNIKLMRDEKRGVWAVGYGGRMIPRKK